ncbi:hypothetical protein MK280_02830, partial [Myxococcota bacterium]|nr:hypothetical protein [Myxococcota bacterium]
HLAESSWEVISQDASDWRVRFDVAHRGVVKSIEGKGKGAIDAFWTGLREAFGLKLHLVDFSEQALGMSSSSEAVSFVEFLDQEGVAWHGVGRDSSTVVAAFRAVMGAVNLFLGTGSRG